MPRHWEGHGGYRRGNSGYGAELAPYIGPPPPLTAAQAAVAEAEFRRNAAAVEAENTAEEAYFAETAVWRAGCRAAGMTEEEIQEAWYLRP